MSCCAKGNPPTLARIGGWALAGIVIAGALGAPIPARSQGGGLPTLPGLPKLASPGPAASAAATATAAVSDDQERERLNNELAEVRAWNDQLTEGDPSSTVPAGVTRDEIA